MTEQKITFTDYHRAINAYNKQLRTNATSITLNILKSFNIINDSNSKEHQKYISEYFRLKIKEKELSYISTFLNTIVPESLKEQFQPFLSQIDHFEELLSNLLHQKKLLFPRVNDDSIQSSLQDDIDLKPQEKKAWFSGLKKNAKHYYNMCFQSNSVNFKEAEIDEKQLIEDYEHLDFPAMENYEKMPEEIQKLYKNDVDCYKESLFLYDRGKNKIYSSINKEDKHQKDTNLFIADTEKKNLEVDFLLYRHTKFLYDKILADQLFKLAFKILSVYIPQKDSSIYGYKNFIRKYFYLNFIDQQNLILTRFFKKIFGKGENKNEELAQFCLPLIVRVQSLETLYILDKIDRIAKTQKPQYNKLNQQQKPLLKITYDKLPQQIKDLYGSFEYFLQLNLASNIFASPDKAWKNYLSENLSGLKDKLFDNIPGFKTISNISNFASNPIVTGGGLTALLAFFLSNREGGSMISLIPLLLGALYKYQFQDD